MLELEILWRLQSIDSEIEMLKKDKKVKELQDQLMYIKKEYNTLKETAGGKLKEKKNTGEETAKLNAELKELYKKYKESSSRLYMNGQNLKAIDNIQKEMDALKFKIDERENKLLNLMERYEELEQFMKDIKTRLTLLMEEFNRDKTIYEEDSGKNTEMISNLNSQRESIVKEVPSHLLEQYNIIALKKGNAVTEVKDGTCEECGGKLSAVLYDVARKKSQICYCEYCGRILYTE